MHINQLMQPLFRISKLIILLALLALSAQSVSAFYDPSLGRWISRDPLQERGEINQFRFCLNSPHNNSDPLGLICVQSAICIFTPPQIRWTTKNDSCPTGYSVSYTCYYTCVVLFSFGTCPPEKKGVYENSYVTCSVCEDKDIGSGCSLIKWDNYPGQWQ
jgi:hypothetical protein